MLQKVNNPHIVTDVSDYKIFSDVMLHTKTLYHEARAAPGAPGRLLLFIHGGAAATNHTIVERPSRWLIDRDLFDTILLPDRRGCGASSPMDHMLTFEEQAEDMQALLDVMGIEKPLTVMGISYGGPIALVQGYKDDRVERVILWASSPTLDELSFPYNLLVKTGLMSWYLRLTYKRHVGKKEPQYPDYDFVYEMQTREMQTREMQTREMQNSKKATWEKWKEILNHTPAERLDSMLLELASMFNPPNRAIPDEVVLDIPVLQIIGSEDETWGRGMPEKYRARFHDFTQVILPDVGHKDALWKADLFLDALAEYLRDETV
jgi:pimeloyl-ACP methyl ester carboxylesterase